MNKLNVSARFDFARRLHDISFKDRPVVDSSSVEILKSPSDSLLCIIYAPDSRTGLPTGDLNYYVSDRANDDVKQFILSNLMNDVSSAKNIANPSGLSDDALLELSRGSSETVEEYAIRMNHEIETFKFFQDQIKNQDVPPKSQEPPVSSE